jgi:hypothetical protein
VQVPRADTFFTWSCDTESELPCPDVPALNPSANADGVTFQLSSLGIDTYFIELTVTLDGDNYVGIGGSQNGSAQISFTTTDSGGN